MRPSPRSCRARMANGSKRLGLPPAVASSWRTKSRDSSSVRGRSGMVRGRTSAMSAMGPACAGRTASRMRADSDDSTMRQAAWVKGASARSINRNGTIPFRRNRSKSREIRLGSRSFARSVVVRGWPSAESAKGLRRRSLIFRIASAGDFAGPWAWTVSMACWPIPEAAATQCNSVVEPQPEGATSIAIWRSWRKKSWIAARASRCGGPKKGCSRWTPSANGSCLRDQ